MARGRSLYADVFGEERDDALDQLAAELSYEGGDGAAIADDYARDLPAMFAQAEADNDVTDPAVYAPRDPGRAEAVFRGTAKHEAPASALSTTVYRPRDPSDASAVLNGETPKSSIDGLAQPIVAQPRVAAPVRPRLPEQAPPGMELRTPPPERTERPLYPDEAPPPATDDARDVPVSPWAALASSPRASGGGSAPADSRSWMMDVPRRESPNQFGNVFALFADAMLNKGRNAGRIISRLATPEDTDYINHQRRVQAAKDAAQIEALGRRGMPRELDPDVMELRRRSQETAEARERRITEETARKAKQQAEELNPESDTAKRVRERVYQVRPALQGQLDGFSYNDMIKVPAVKAIVQADLESERRAAEGKEFNRRQAVQDSYAQNREQRGVDIDIAKEQRGLELDAARADATEAREVAKASKEIPGFRVVNEEAYVAAMRDPTTRKKAEDAAGAYTVLNENLRKMRELRAKHGGEIPGEAQAEYDGYKTLAIGSVTTIAQTGVLNGTEYERYSTMIPETGLRVWDFTNLFGKDIRGEQLEGVSRALSGSVNSGLRKWGVVYESPEDEAKRRASQPKPKRAAPRKAASADDGWRDVGAAADDGWRDVQ